MPRQSLLTFHPLTESNPTGTWTENYSSYNRIVAISARHPDGVIRKVRVRQSPDHAFAISGRSTVAGVNITGNVYVDGASGEYVFNPARDHDQYDRMQGAILERKTRGQPDLGEQVAEGYR